MEKTDWMNKKASAVLLGAMLVIFMTVFSFIPVQATGDEPSMATVSSDITNGVLRELSEVKDGEDYCAVIEPDSIYYTYPNNITITIGGSQYKEFIYDKMTGEVIIQGADVNDEIKITATCERRYAKITTNIQNGYTNSVPGIPYGIKYECTVMHSSSYNIPQNVEVTIGGTDYTGYSYRIYEAGAYMLGHISIPGEDVTGDIVITAICLPSTTEEPSTTIEIPITTQKPVKQFIGICGDVSGDGVVDLVDVVLMSKHTAELIILEGEEFLLGDVNVDNLVDLVDMVTVQRYLAKLSSMPVGQDLYR